MSYTSWIEAVKSVGSSKKHKEGDVWLTKDKNWRGMNPAGDPQSYVDKDDAVTWSKGKIPAAAPKDEPEAEPEAEKEPEKEPSKEPKSTKPTGEVLDSIPTEKKGTVPSPRDQIASRIEEIDDSTTKKTAQEVKKKMDQFVNAETDEEKEEILRWMADNNLIQINTEDPKS